MSNITVEVCIKALSNAAMSRRAALQTELAVGLAIFLTQGGTEKAARTMLVEAYASAGNACLSPADDDYKTVNRRINATADLFNKIGMRAIKKWAGKHDDDQLIAAMVEGLRPYELWTVYDVQRYASTRPDTTVDSTPAPTAAPSGVKPHTAILTGPQSNATGQEKIVGMFRRAADQVAKGADHIETEHLALMVPKDVDVDELVSMAQKILAMAAARRKNNTPEAAPA